MQCIFCSAWTSVAETRGVRRRRKCGNNHSFWTKEVAEQDNVKRDRLIADAVVLHGMRMKDAAIKFGVRSDSYASKVVRLHYPEYNARSSGQKRKGKR